MAVPWGLLVFVIGFAYGFFTPGRQNKGHILKMGILWGIVIAIVLAVLGYFTSVPALGLGGGFIGIIIEAIVLTLLFVLGVWLGDMLEGRRTRHV